MRGQVRERHGGQHAGAGYSRGDIAVWTQHCCRLTRTVTVGPVQGWGMDQRVREELGWEDSDSTQGGRWSTEAFPSATFFVLLKYFLKKAPCKGYRVWNPQVQLEQTQQAQQQRAMEAEQKAAWDQRKAAWDQHRLELCVMVTAELARTGARVDPAQVVKGVCARTATPPRFRANEDTRYTQGVDRSDIPLPLLREQIIEPLPRVPRLV